MKIIEIVLGLAVALYTGHGLSQKANRIAQAEERIAMTLERAYPRPIITAPTPPSCQKELRDFMEITERHDSDLDLVQGTIGVPR